MTGIEIKAVFVALVIALGITAPVPDVLGGLIIAIGCSYGVMIVSEPSTRLSVWATIFLGVIASIMFALLHKHVKFVSEFPLQAVMGFGGGLSRFVAEATIGFGKTATGRIADLPNKIKLPGEK